MTPNEEADVTVTSIAQSIHAFKARYGKDPEKIFMSSRTYNAVKRSFSMVLHITPDGPCDRFMGIPVTPFSGSEPEYYLAEERGHFWKEIEHGY